MFLQFSHGRAMLNHHARACFASALPVHFPAGPRTAGGTFSRQSGTESEAASRTLRILRKMALEPYAAIEAEYGQKKSLHWAELSLTFRKIITVTAGASWADCLLNFRAIGIVQSPERPLANRRIPAYRAPHRRASGSDAGRVAQW